jgi:hypothetical protein
MHDGIFKISLDFLVKCFIWIDGAIVGLRYNALQEKLKVGLLRLLPVVFGVATSSREHFRQAFDLNSIAGCPFL